MTSFQIRTERQTQFIDITHQVRSAVQNDGIKDGFVLVYIPHTTAGITINENADPDVVTDITGYFDKLVPDLAEFRHMEGNSSAHIKTLITGTSTSIPVNQGQLMLGTWQGIYFCEYDGPRNRQIIVQPISK